MQDIDATSSFSEGDEYVCSVCSQLVKPCEIGARFQCKDKILGETMLHDLVQRVHEVSNGRPAACLICGKTLTPREMGNTGLRDLCPACQAACDTVERGMIDKGMQT